MSVNVHVYQTGIAHESRLIRHTEALSRSALFSDVCFIGATSGLDEVVNYGSGLRATLISKPDVRRSDVFSKLFATRKWGRKVVSKSIELNPDVLTCHSLPTLSICNAIKQKLGCKLVYEPHELETETYVSRGLRKYASKYLERSLIKGVDAVIVVSDGIADWYQQAYDIQRPVVVRNIPESRVKPSALDCPSIRELHSIPDSEVVFLYQGHIGGGRRIEQYLEVFSELKRPYHLVFMGNVPLQGLIEVYAEQCANIDYQPAVPSEEVLLYTATADIGLCGVDNACLSYFFSLPNKLFEFMAAGLPSLVPAFPEMKNEILRTGAGWIHGETNEELIEVILKITKEEVVQYSDLAKKASIDRSWHFEKKELLKAYESL